jgi:hypothetical protein
MGRSLKVNLASVEEFIQPGLSKILYDVGLDYGLSLKEAKHLYLTYYKEFVLKSMSQGDFKRLRLLNIGNIHPSLKKTTNFKKSKHNTEKYEEVINRIYSNCKKNKEES